MRPAEIRTAIDELSAYLLQRIDQGRDTAIAMSNSTSSNSADQDKLRATGDADFEDANARAEQVRLLAAGPTARFRHESQSAHVEPGRRDVELANLQSLKLMAVRYRLRSDFQPEWNLGVEEQWNRG